MSFIMDTQNNERLLNKMKLELVRKYFLPTYTIGKLYVDGEFFCDTLELPWKDNAKNISCIPIGTYKVEFEWSHHFGRMLPHILNVPNRTEVMVHPANFPSEIKGCVAVGRNTIKGGLTQSRHYSDILNIVLASSNDNTITIS